MDETKTLATIASKLCKRYPILDGCCDMHRPQDIEKVLRLYPVEDVWGIGSRRARTLTAQGFEQFKTNRNHLSKRFTTDWNEIIRVKV